MSVNCVRWSHRVRGLPLIAALATIVILPACAPPAEDLGAPQAGVWLEGIEAGRCRVEAQAVLTELPCDEDAAAVDEEAFARTLEVSSAAAGWTRLRTTRHFDKRELDNVAGRLSSGAQLCGRQRGSTTWEVLRRDPEGRVCTAFVSAPLLHCALPAPAQQPIDCRRPEAALPVDADCPAANRLTAMPAGLVSATIDEPNYCFARIRSGGAFEAAEQSNVLADAEHGQALCRWPSSFKHITADGSRGAVYQRVLLRDATGRLCFGAVADQLIR